MSGTQTQVEGAGVYYVRFLLLVSAPATPQNTLQAGFDVSQLTNRSTCWADDVAANYRWDGASVAVHNGTTIIRPSGQDASVPGRWLVESLASNQQIVWYPTIAAFEAAAAPPIGSLVGITSLPNSGFPSAMGGVYSIGSTVIPVDGTEQILTTHGYLSMVGHQTGVSYARVTTAGNTVISAPGTLTPVVATFGAITAAFAAFLGNVATVDSAGVMTALRARGTVYKVTAYARVFVSGSTTARRISIGYRYTDGTFSQKLGYATTVAVGADSYADVWGMFPGVSISPVGRTLQLAIANETDTATLQCQNFTSLNVEPIVSVAS